MNETANPSRDTGTSATTPHQAVILAGGRGMRLHPYTHVTNKCLLKVHGQTLIEKQIGILRDQLGVTSLVIVLGYLGDQIRTAVGDGSALGVEVRYVEVERVEDGPAAGLLRARDLIDGPFFLMLGDEYFNSSRHDRLLDWIRERRPDALLTFTRPLNPHQILANFTIDMDDDGRVCSITEKPDRVDSDVCGTGTLYLTPRIFEVLEHAEPSPRSGRVELYEAVAAMGRDGRVYAVDLEEPEYVNINTFDDLRRAVFTHRAHHFSEFTISVIIPTWNEATSIHHVVRDFLHQPQVVEVLVMDNQSPDGSGEIARRAGARVISEKLLGYGDAIHKGLNAAVGDILVVVEADYSFRANDMPKLLEYMKDADIVIGTRTTRQLIAQGANMAFLARMGNIVMAKYLEALWFWLELRLTDVGCTYRAVWRNVWHEVEGNIRSKGPEFSVEMIIEMVKARKNCIEVPVSYHPRFGGESKHSQGLLGLSRTALRMWSIITRRWAETVWNIVRNSATDEHR